MDKFDFINRIIALYPHAIQDSKAQYETYKHSLSTSEKVDYDAVFDIYCKEYKNSFPPPPGQIQEWALRCIKPDYQPSSKWIHVKIYNPIDKAVVNTDCFPAGTSEEKILNFYKKRFGGEGWRIEGITNA